MCRVSNRDIIIFERIENKIKGHQSNTGRPLQYYKDLFANSDFELLSSRFIKIQASYFACGSIRKVFEGKEKKEGQPVKLIVRTLEKLVLPITRYVDSVLASKRDLGMLHFKKKL